MYSRSFLKKVKTIGKIDFLKYILYITNIFEVLFNK